MKKAKTWIVTCIYLQLLFTCFGSPCRSTLPDAEDDINQLVGNIPSDYIMPMRNISKNSLPKHCWFLVLLKEVSDGLIILSSKFANNSSSYKNASRITLIFRDIRNCVPISDDQIGFVDDYFDIYTEKRTVNPMEFFQSALETISLFKELNQTELKTPCELPTEEPTQVDPVTRGSLQFASSQLRNGVRNGIKEQKETSSSNLSLPWTSIASIVIGCTVVGFLLGVLCWKIKHQRDQANNEVPDIHKKEDNELNNMLQLQAPKEISVI